MDTPAAIPARTCAVNARPRLPWQTSAVTARKVFSRSVSSGTARRNRAEAPTSCAKAGSSAASRSRLAGVVVAVVKVLLPQ
ncbi:hypothetical protein OG494_01730 [Amycolatopsis sp. NBC_00438]